MPRSLSYESYTFLRAVLLLACISEFVVLTTIRLPRNDVIDRLFISNVLREIPTHEQSAKQGKSELQQQSLVKPCSPSTTSILRFPNQAARMNAEGHSSEHESDFNETDISAFSKLQLFVPSFPGGFEEFQSTLIRGLQFFWPLENLKITVVLDDTVYETVHERSAMTDKVHSFFRKEIPVTVAYNPRSNKTLYNSGWDIQQLIMFWADNFTPAEYIGFIDDDTLFSKAVLPHDLFDPQGRPRVLSRYPAGTAYTKLFYNWHRASYWALGNPSFMNAMSYFPVIIRRKHLQEIREAMLQNHPEFACFDDLFVALINLGFRFPFSYSQFVIMVDYLWLHHRDEYSWRLAQDGQRRQKAFFPNGYPHEFEGYNVDFTPDKFAIAKGSLEELGVTPDMLRPFPRVAVHASYIPKGRNRALSARRALVNEILARGYCFSQPLLPSLRDASFVNLCQQFFPNITEDINARCEWTFEVTPFWDYDDEGVRKAHLDRMKRNIPRDWDVDELRTVLQLQNRRIADEAGIQCTFRSLVESDVINH